MRCGMNLQDDNLNLSVNTDPNVSKLITGSTEDLDNFQNTEVSDSSSVNAVAMRDPTEIDTNHVTELSVAEAFNLVRQDYVPTTKTLRSTESDMPISSMEEEDADISKLSPTDMTNDTEGISSNSVWQDAASSCDAVENDHSSTGDTFVRINWLHSPPKLIACAEKDYFLSPPKCSSENYLRGCVWSPDGSCILTNSRDNVLRLFNLPKCLFAESVTDDDVTEEMAAVLTMREHELVYDYVWYPSMSSSDPSTCCFASTVRRNPIRLWDAFTGEVRATYRPINHLGELISAYSIAFSADGQRLYAGFNRFMHVFDVGRPGRDSVRRPRLGKKPTQGGIISCIAVPKHSDRQIYSTGSYNGSVVVYAEPGNPIMHLETGSAGVTQVQFSARVGNETSSPWYLLAGNRMDSRVFLWDARQPKIPLLVVHRRVENHQRFQFDLDPLGEYLFTGSQTGVVYVYNLSVCLENYHSCQLAKPAMVWRAHSDCAHGLSVNHVLPVVATSSGQRRIRPPAIVLNRAKRPRRIDATHDSNPTSGGEESRQTDQSSSSSDNSSSASETGLTDEEASLIPPAQVDSVCAIQMASGARSLPLWGKLTRLPRENRLCLWSFPTMTHDSDQSMH